MSDDLMLKDDPRIPLYIENRRLKREIERLRAALRSCVGACVRGTLTRLELAQHVERIGKEALDE